MFSNTAYEAMYYYIGLSLHSKFIEVITSQRVFMGVVLLIFGTLFFLTTAQFFSRYVPGALIKRRSVPLSKYVKIVACLFIGIAVLKVGTHTSVRRFSGESWHNNPYVASKIRAVAAPDYKVSFLFDILSRTAEEISALISRIIDDVFQRSNSQLEAPDFFFKALMYAGVSSIDDPKLQKSIEFYTQECFDRVLPFVKESAKTKKLDLLFQNQANVDQRLEDIYIERPDKKPYNCLDVKNEVRDALKEYTWKKTQEGSLEDKLAKHLGIPDVYKAMTNYQMSSFLVNHYMDQHEDSLGIQKGAQLPSATSGRVVQFINRLFRWDGILGVLGAREQQGVVLAAQRSQEFSEQLARAPHIAGFIKMLIIAAFPWLVFFIVAGYWRVLFDWFLIYLSVLLWTPIWTLLYHIMVGITLSADVMSAFGNLSDGVSIYSAQLVSSRIYHIYAVYSWLQILTGTLFTGLILFFIRPALSDTEEESKPEFLDTAQRTVSSVRGVV